MIQLNIPETYTPAQIQDLENQAVQSYIQNHPAMLPGFAINNLTGGSITIEYVDNLRNVISTENVPYVGDGTCFIKHWQDLPENVFACLVPAGANRNYLFSAAVINTDNYSYSSDSSVGAFPANGLYITNAPDYFICQAILATAGLTADQLTQLENQAVQAYVTANPAPDVSALENAAVQAYIAAHPQSGGGVENQLLIQNAIDVNLTVQYVAQDQNTVLGILGLPSGGFVKIAHSAVPAGTKFINLYAQASKVVDTLFVYGDANGANNTNVANLNPGGIVNQKNIDIGVLANVGAIFSDTLDAYDYCVFTVVQPSSLQNPA